MADERPDHFFTAVEAGFAPSRAARGYWLRGTLNGSAAASILAWVIERDHLEPGWVPVRFSVDMLRMPPEACLQVETTVVHASNRLRLIEASLIAGDRVTTRGVCQIVRCGEQPANPLWQSPRWPAPDPETLPPHRHYGRWESRPIPPGNPRFARQAPAGGSADQGNPPVLGAIAPVECRQTWLRPDMVVVAGSALTPFQLVVTTADFASPLAHSSAFGIDFVNTDFTVHLHRLPQGRWIGYELAGHGSAHGIAMGHVAVHDAAGPIGLVAVSAIANARRREG